MDKYREAEKRLAELLGWTHHNESERDGPPWRGPDGIWRHSLPRWCRDWSACGPLMVEHDVDIDFTSSGLSVTAIINTRDMYYKFLVTFKDHPDRETAVRYAIATKMARHCIPPGILLRTTAPKLALKQFFRSLSHGMILA